MKTPTKLRFPDLHLSNDDIIISGDRAALRWSAPEPGKEMGFPATHNTVRLTGIDIRRIENGHRRRTLG